MYKKFLYLVCALFLSCEMEHNVKLEPFNFHVSIVETWREFCAVKFNKYDYPDESQRDQIIAECLRKFADGEFKLELENLDELNLSDEFLERIKKIIENNH